MAYIDSVCMFAKKIFSPRKLLLSSLLIVSTYLMIIFWAESYLSTGPLSYLRNQEQTTVKKLEPLDEYLHKLPTENKLLLAVDKLPFKEMTPSKLLLEDLYFSPSIHKLTHYNNFLIQQPQDGCRGSEFLLILVPSHPDSVSERRAIRETWGTAARGRAWPWKGHSFPVKLIFALGVTGTSSFTKNLVKSNMADRHEDENSGIDTTSYSIKNNVGDTNSSKLFQTEVNSINGKIRYENNGRVIKLEAKENLRNSNLSMEDLLPDKLATDGRREHAYNSRLTHVPEQRSTVSELKPSTFNSETDLIPEISSFDDIIQFDMIDSYKNLTRKMILSLQWLVKSCTEAKFILKVDPDVFVNIPLLTTFLKHYGELNSIYGHILPNSLVNRDGKWAVSKAALPIPKYPIYVAGNAYVISKDAAVKIIELSTHFLYVHVEDAFITGILASVGGVKRVNVGGFTKWKESRPDPCEFVKDKRYVGNNFTEYHHRIFWREINDNGSFRCDT